MQHQDPNKQPAHLTMSEAVDQLARRLCNETNSGLGIPTTCQQACEQKGNCDFFTIAKETLT